jgi:hypothetical protein
VRGSIVIAIILFTFFCGNISAKELELCESSLALLDQPNFKEQFHAIAGFKDKISPLLPKLKTHSTTFLQNRRTNQALVLLGERHRKPIYQTDYIDTFSRQFSTIAVEKTEDEVPYALKNTRSTSNLTRALQLDRNLHAVFPIDKNVSQIFNPYYAQILAGLFTAYGLALDLISTLQGTPHPSVATFSLLMGAGIYATFGADMAIGTFLHSKKMFRTAKLLPITYILLNKRNLAMTKNLSYIVKDLFIKRPNLLVIVGGAHVPQMKHELEKQGFEEVPLHKPR